MIPLAESRSEPRPGILRVRGFVEQLRNFANAIRWVVASPAPGHREFSRGQAPQAASLRADQLIEQSRLSRRRDQPESRKSPE